MRARRSISARPRFRIGPIWRATCNSAPELSFRIHTDLASIEGEWRAFEQTADATPFQSFDWLSTWQRRVGTLDGTVPAVAIGRFGDGRTAFIFPLAVEPRRLMRRYAGSASIYATTTRRFSHASFSNRVTPDGFRTLWDELLKEIRSDPRLRHDWIEFERMPQTVGAQTNPFTFLGVTPDANSAHITRLGGEWQVVLPRQALVGDAPARPRQAQAHGGIRRDRLPDRFGRERHSADAGNFVGAEEADLRTQGNCRDLRAAGISRIPS